MSREKSQLLSGAGTSFEIVKAIADSVYEQGGNDDDVRRILKEKQIRKSIAELLVVHHDEVLTIPVNRDRTIAEGVAVGKYDWVNDDIADKNFPRSGSGNELTEIILVHFDKSMSTDGVLKEFEKRSLRPADLQELLAIGEHCPDKQRAFPIIALASVWRPDGSRRVPCLGGSDSARGLRLDWIDDDWSDFFRFAAVRK